MPITIDSRFKDADMSMGFAGETFVCGHDGATLYFYVSYDGGLTYSASVTVGIIGSATPKTFKCFQEHASGGSRLRITNGNDTTYTSDDYGNTWVAV